MAETKNEKFTRMRDVRMPKAVKAVELLGNLASRDYEYSPEEAATLVDTLYDAVEAVADAFGVEASEKPTEAAPAPAVAATGGTKDPALHDAYRLLSEDQKRIADFYEYVRNWVGS